MEQFINFFSSLPNHYKLAWIFIVLGITWVLEFLSPLVKSDYAKWKHVGQNMVFLATTILINVVFGLLTLGVFSWVEESRIGVFHLFDFNPWVVLVLSIAALDVYAQWIAHYLLH